MRFLTFGIFFFSASLASAQFKNIELAVADGLSYPPLEPSVAINPRNPKNIVVGTVMDRVFATKDGGKTWKADRLKSPLGVAGDPCVTVDYQGSFYYFHLGDPSGKGQKNEAWLDMMVCQKSTDGGYTWSEGVPIGKNSPKDQDKEWATAVPGKNHLALTWTQFDKYGSTDENCRSHIMFSYSSNGGKKWSAPRVLSQLPGNCLDDDQTAEGGMTAFDSKGKVYVTWAFDGKIYLNRSYDGGKVWLTHDIVVSEQTNGWAQDVPGISRTNGFPIIQADNSKSRFNSRLYIVWADQRRGENNTDVWIKYSSNGGDFWSEARRVNQDTTLSHQFFPWMCVDQITGNLYVVYYDRRNYDDLRTDVYLACSVNGGQNFREWKVTDTPFIPDKEVFFGDYTNIAAYNGHIAAVWTRMDEGKTSVWVTLIREEELK
ncbi:MAG: glycosyl hydrolase [Candidatus Nephrothrix sp. EaCA]|nr:MAG: glycosyl hydrolase [Candidatus Nephrothrix sp. EaCA]